MTRDCREMVETFSGCSPADMTYLTGMWPPGPHLDAYTCGQGYEPSGMERRGVLTSKSPPLIAHECRLFAVNSRALLKSLSYISYISQR